MPSLRAVLLTLLPKVLLSRTTGLLASLPLPTPLRAPFYSWFARRYGAELSEVQAPLSSFRSLQAFFQRELRQGARPIEPVARSTQQNGGTAKCSGECWCCI